MKSLILFCFISCVYGYLLPRVQDDSWEDYGAFDSTVKIGNVSERYYPLAKDDLKASKRGAQFLQNMKQFFVHGLFTLPPLDPYTRQVLPSFVVANEKYLSVNAQLSNLNLTGLVKFTTDLMEIRYGNGRVDYRVKIPSLNINAAARVEAVVGRILPFKANGLLSILLSDVVALGALQVVQVPRKNNRVYQLSAQHTVLHAGDVKAKFVSNQSDHAVKSSLLGYGSGSWEDCLKVLLQRLNEYVCDLVLKQANAILDGPTVDQINSILLGDQ